MSFMFWQADYATGIEAVDEQHRHLFALINELYTRILDCENMEEERRIAGQILQSLIYYVEEHFSAEEALFSHSKYPDTTAHKAAHNHFQSKLDDLLQSHQAGKLGLSNDILIFLRDWLIGHVTKTDMSYVPYVGE